MSFKQILSSGIHRISLLFLFTGFIQSLYAQSHTQVNPALLSPQVSANQVNPQPVEGTLHMVAIMVEFEPEENRFTSGNGTFAEGAIPYLETPGTNVDALPHDRGFFESRLEFARNYFETMSGGRLSVEFTVLPEIYRLPHPMQEYSPVGEDPELTPLAQLAADAWQLVADDGVLDLGLTNADNIAFVLFHAGIGRDIELTGTTLDRTPQDIPSVYLSRNALARLLDDPGFSGFPIDNGNLIVNNTLILPRTLSRAGEDITGSRFVIPLSANGMVTAQLGSHLGLPDLFNTETGESGIGRFGLMDGAGIFAYNGLFPPRLSAFEKTWLGWADPISVSYTESDPVPLAASALGEPAAIARIPISDREYFLAENRHRDPLGEGVTLTIRRPDGSVVQQTFSNSDLEFVNQEPGFDTLLEPGLITAVSNYDFALPGGLIADENNRELNGGILIWHVDESVISEKLGRAGINSNTARRAVNLQEADGAQDIGRPIRIGLFENPVNGSPFDFWWSGNNATVITQTGREITLYQNRFGPDTTPDNRSNSGAHSFFELYDFSDNLPVASFRIRPANPYSNLYEPADPGTELDITTVNPSANTYLDRYPLSIIPVSTDGQNLALIPGINGLRFYDIDSQTASQLPADFTSAQQPLFIEAASSFLIISENPHNRDGTIETAILHFNGTDWETDEIITNAPNPGFISRSGPTVIDFDGTPTRYNFIDRELSERDDGIRQSSGQSGQFRSVIRNESLEISFPGGTMTHPLPQSSRLHTGIVDLPGQDAIFYLLTDSALMIYQSDDDYARALTAAESESIGWPAIIDLNGNGSPDFLFADFSRNQLAGVNRNGGFLDGFPVSPPAGTRFTGTPLIADLNGDGELNLIVSVQDNYSVSIMAYTNTGEKLEGFPLHAGSVVSPEDSPVNPAISFPNLVSVSHTGELKMWRFPQMGEVAWATAYGNNPDNNVSGLVSGDPVQEETFTLLNRDETYNWPNPAREETYLRFQTSRAVEVGIRIATLSGRTVYDRTITSRGGPPEEILIDTSGWPSGAYFARVTARDGSRTESKTVRIAVAR
jgi:hypothetical protein